MSQPDIDMFIKKLEARFKDITNGGETGFFETLGGKIPGASSGQVSPYWTDIINQTLQNTINSRVTTITKKNGIFPQSLNKDDLLFDDEGKLLVPSWGERSNYRSTKGFYTKCCNSWDNDNGRR